MYNEIIRIKKGANKGMNYAERELKRLADFLLERYPQEVEGGNLNGDESPVDVTVRLLSKEKKFMLVRGEHQSIEDFDRIKGVVKRI